jgi:hypothetical protein
MVSLQIMRLCADLEWTRVPALARAHVPVSYLWLRQRAGMSPEREAASRPDDALGSVSAVPVARSATGAVASKS